MSDRDDAVRGDDALERGEVFGRGDSLHARRHGYGRAVRIGLGISLLVHLFMLFVIGRSLRIEAPETRLPAEPTAALQGQISIEVGAIVPPSAQTEEDEPSPAEEEPDEEAADEEPAAGPVVPDPGRAEADAEEEGYLTNAEKLQPKEGDERLYPEYDRDQIPEYLAENPYAAYEGEIRSRLSMMLDSLNLTDRQRREAVEWLTGEEGEEWGVSEEGIHLGGVVIPIDLSMLLREQGPRGREARQEQRDLENIRYQDMIGEAEEIREDRAREMRERTKEELERRVRDSLEAVADSLEEDAAEDG